MTRASDLARLMGAGGTLNAALSVDTISEKTSGNGVTIDSLNIKDSGIGGQQIGGRRNMVINGAMQVAQRATSVTGLGATSGYYTLDRFRSAFGNTAGRLTMTQTADGPSGFANCLKYDCTTADTSLAVNEYLILGHYFEGQDLQGLKKGTSEAEKVTVSFYVKGNGNATYMVELYDGDNNRHNTQQFAVTSSWNRISLTFDGDTTGAYDDDNALSLYLNFWLHAGSSYSGGTYTANTWASNTNGNRAAGVDSFFSSTDNTFFITGVQMELGSQATPFEHRSFGEELALAQRYYQKITGSSSIYVATNGSSTTSRINGMWATTMRATPTSTIDSGWTAANLNNMYQAYRPAGDHTFPNIAADAEL